MLYVHDLNVDTAILRHTDKCFIPEGFSATVGAYISGPIDADEQVIIDFSTVKGLLKQYIDATIDHGCIVCCEGDTKVDDLKNCDLDFAKYFKDLAQWETDIPTTYLYKFYFYRGDETLPSSIVEDVLNTEVKKFLKSKDLNIEVRFELINSGLIVPFNNSVSLPIKYCHGLPNSSSVPCRFPFHGHSGVICVKPHFMIDTQKIQNALFRLGLGYQKVLFVNKAHLFKASKSDLVSEESTILFGQSALTTPSTYSYTDAGGNEFFSYMDDPLTNITLCILDNDSTIENIVEFIADMLAAQLVDYVGEVFDLYISEGIKKGAITTRVIA